MPKITYDKIVDYELWNRIKARFGFYSQEAKDIFFRNECIFTQPMDVFMSDPQIGVEIHNAAGVNIEYYAEVPAGHRWRVLGVAYISAATTINAVYIKDADGNNMGLDKMVATGDYACLFPEPVILLENWDLGYSFTGAGIGSANWYYIDEVVK